MEKTEDASLAADEPLGPGPDADLRRLEPRLNRVVTVDVMEAFVRREGVRVALTWNWDDGRPCVEEEMDSMIEMRVASSTEWRKLTSTIGAASRGVDQGHYRCF